MQLAQNATAAPAGNPLALMGVVGALLGVVVLLTVVILFVRRRMLGPEQEGDAAVGLLEQLRRMHQRGELSDEEFQATKARLAGGIKGVGTAREAGKGRSQVTPARPRKASTPRPRPDGNSQGRTP